MNTTISPRAAQVQPIRPDLTAAPTAGLWYVGDDSDNDYEGPRIVDHDDYCVAVVTIQHPTDSTDEERANARLIAAAPELLEALEDASYPGGLSEEMFSRWLPRARAAIAKAKGQP